MNLNKLKGKIVENGMNTETLAKEIGVDRSTMYRMLNNLEKITVGKAVKIKSVLALSDEDATDIFLS